MKKFRIISYVLFVLALIIKYISGKYNYIVEQYYSSGINIYTVKFLSKLTSTFKFSYFEILLYIFLISIILSIIYLIYSLFKNKNRFLKIAKDIGLNYLAVLSLVYFLFIVLWGVNYNRCDLGENIKLEYTKAYDKNLEDLTFDNEDLANLYEFLIEKCNETSKIVANSNSEPKNNSESIDRIISNLQNGYDNVELLGLNKLGDYSRAKIILNSKLLSYTDITGIYSPFTGEANINTNQPLISLPFTVLHEMAHQRGYANESECNFLAYISCIKNEDVYVNYSGYFMALKYTMSALFVVDYNKFVELTQNIDEDVLEDLREYSRFWAKYQGSINEISTQVNDAYLKSNSVDEGIKSYGKMVDLLMLYNYLYE